MPSVPPPRSESRVIHDTVFDVNMRVVCSREPADVIRRLQHGFPEDWVKVCVGATGVVVSVSDYLYGDLHGGIVKSLWELIEAREKAAYVRDPSRYEKLVDRYATRLINRVRDESKQGE